MYVDYHREQIEVNHMSEFIQSHKQNSVDAKLSEKPLSIGNLWNKNLRKCSKYFVVK